MLVRNLAQRAERSEEGSERKEGANAVEAYHKMRECWLNFCLFPDVVPPCRMPSMFPIPTHLVRRQRVFNISPTTAGDTIFGLFCPEYWPCNNQDFSALGTSTLGPAAYEGIRTAFGFASAGSSTSYISNGDANAQQIPNANLFMTPSITGTATVVGEGGTFSSTNVAHGGVRLIGSYIEFEYVGTTEQHSGMIEVGLMLHNASNLSELGMFHLLDSSEIIQAPFYRKFRPIDGARCVWFPVDNQDFEFGNYSTDWVNNRLYYQTETNTANNITGTNAFEHTPATTLVITFSDVSQALGRLKKNVYPRWAINISGLQQGQQIRVHMCSYYETVPDENFRDIFMPKRSLEYSDPSKSKAAVTQLAQQGVFSTPAKTSGGWSNVLSAIQGAADIAMKSYGVVAPIVSGFSAGPGAGILGAIGQLSGFGNYAKMMTE